MSNVLTAEFPDNSLSAGARLWSSSILYWLILEFCQTKPCQTKPSCQKILGWMWNDILHNFYLWYLIGLWVNWGVLPNQTIPNQAKWAVNSLDTIKSNFKQLLPLTLYCICQIMAIIFLSNRKKISNLPFWGP